MALLPIAWDIGFEEACDVSFGQKPYIRGSPPPQRGSKRFLFDYPAYKDLGTVFQTNFTLKLHACKRSGQKLKTTSQKTIYVELERFLNLNEINVQGSISLHEKETCKRVAWKTFHHAYKNSEKSFCFEMNFVRSMPLCMFSNLCLHGHISVDSVDTKVTTSSMDHCEADFSTICPNPEMHKTFSRLSRDFHNLFENKCFSDVTLKCGDVDLYVHKSILSSRSPVFKAMFEKNDMKESITNEVEITDMNPSALRSMLNYMYCGKTDDLSDIEANNLLYAADKYQLLELKETCVSYLKSAISNTNIYLILTDAGLHDENLKFSAFNYIGENFSTIENTNEWKSFKKEKPALVVEILSHIIKLQDQ